MLPVPTDLECEWSLEYCHEGRGGGRIASTDGEWSIATQQILDASKRLHRTKGYLRRAAFRRMPQLYRDGYEPEIPHRYSQNMGAVLSGRSFFPLHWLCTALNGARVGVVRAEVAALGV